MSNDWSTGGKEMPMKELAPLKSVALNDKFSFEFIQGLQCVIPLLHVGSFSLGDTMNILNLVHFLYVGITLRCPPFWEIQSSGLIMIKPGQK